MTPKEEEDSLVQLLLHPQSSVSHGDTYQDMGQRQEQQLQQLELSLVLMLR